MPTIQYNGEGDCNWELRVKNSGRVFEGGADGHRLELENSVPFTEAVCAINGTIYLKVTISAIGKERRELSVYHFCLS